MLRQIVFKQRDNVFLLTLWSLEKLLLIRAMLERRAHN